MINVCMRYLRLFTLVNNNHYDVWSLLFRNCQFCCYHLILRKETEEEKKEEKNFLHTNGRTDEPIKGSIRGPRGPKNTPVSIWTIKLIIWGESALSGKSFGVRLWSSRRVGQLGKIGARSSLSVPFSDCLDSGIIPTDFFILQNCSLSLGRQHSD